MIEEVVEKHEDVSYDTWYMEFDTMTLLPRKFAEEDLLNVMEYFTPERIDYKFPEVKLNPSHYLLNVGQGLKQIIRTLYSFFRVEEKLTEDNTIKKFFSSLVSLLRTDMAYSDLFFVKSETFIFYRTMACLLRGIKFYTYLYDKIKEYKSKMDENFFANMKEVYLYMLQRLREMLAYQTRSICFSDITKLQRLIIHLINILIIFFEYPTKVVVFNQQIEEEYITEIGKYNEKCYYFKMKPQDDVTNEVMMDEEIDPVLIQKNKEEEDY